MDSFDISSLDSFIKKYKEDIKGKLDSLQLNSKTIANQSDLVCMVLDYSLNIKGSSKQSKKYKIKNESNHLPDLIMKSNANRSLTLERPVSESNENNSDEDSNIDDSLYRASQGDINDFIRDMVYTFIDNAFVVERISRVSTSGLLLNGKIRVYIFSTKNFIEVEITSEENFALLKRIVLNKLENAVNLSIHYHTPDAYEFRLSSNKLPLMNQPPILDTENVIEFGKDMVCFVEKQNYISSTSGIFDIKPKKLYGAIISNSEESKINLKVYIKLDVNNISSTIIQMSTENSLKNVLEKIASKKRLNYRNIELYFFVEHSENGDNEDMDNAISMDMELKYLSTFELDLYFKKFPDMPDYLMSYSQSYRINLNNNTNVRKSRLSSDDDKNVQEFVFNDVSAGVYKEFEVVKIKRSKTKVERVLGIDMYNLYNEFPKNNSKNIAQLFTFHNKIKKPLRKIKDVKNCDYVTNNSFFIEFVSDGKKKQVIYEVKSINVRNEIVGKLKYLIVSLLYNIHIENESKQKIVFKNEINIVKVLDKINVYISFYIIPLLLINLKCY